MPNNNNCPNAMQRLVKAFREMNADQFHHYFYSVGDALEELYTLNVESLKEVREDFEQVAAQRDQLLRENNELREILRKIDYKE